MLLRFIRFLIKPTSLPDTTRYQQSWNRQPQLWREKQHSVWGRLYWEKKRSWKYPEEKLRLDMGLVKSTRKYSPQVSPFSLFLVKVFPLTRGHWLAVSFYLREFLFKHPKRTATLSMRNTSVMKKGGIFSADFLKVFLPSLLLSHLLAIGLGIYIGRRLTTSTSTFWWRFGSDFCSHSEDSCLSCDS